MTVVVRADQHPAAQRGGVSRGFPTDLARITAGPCGQSVYYGHAASRPPCCSQWWVLGLPSRGQSYAHPQRVGQTPTNARVYGIEGEQKVISRFQIQPVTRCAQSEATCGRSSRTSSCAYARQTASSPRERDGWRKRTHAHNLGKPRLRQSVCAGLPLPSQHLISPGQ